MISVFLRLVLLLAVVLPLAAPLFAQPEPGASRLVVVGPVLTMDPARPTAEGVVCVNGRIIGVCDAASAEAEAAVPGTRVLRIPEGGIAMPGIIESHAHFLGVGSARRELDVSGTTSIEAVLARVRTAAAGRPEGTWIVGRGWNQELWPDRRFPDAGVLDAAAPRHPVFLTRVDGHAAWVNTLALDHASVSAATPSPAGGELQKDGDGRPTGILVDNAVGLVGRVVPASNDPALIEADALAAEAAALANGITTFVDAGIDPARLVPIDRLYAERRLKLRLYFMLSVDTEQDLERLLGHGPILSLHDDRVAVRALKLYADGALGSRGAKLLEPYADRPDTRGLGVVPQSLIENAARRALTAGYQVCVHAIGDAAVRETLDSFERALAGSTAADRTRHRFRLEHAQLVHPQDVARFAKLGVLPSMQTCHAISDGTWAADRLGAERTERSAYPWRSLLDAGAIIPNGTDAPVEPLSPWRNLFAATTRVLTTADGKPSVFVPSQRMNRLEALESMTVHGAVGTFSELTRGRLRPGFHADLVVLDRDVLRCSVWDLEATRVLATVIAGEVVFGGGP